MLTRLRLIGAFGALITALGVGWQCAPPAPTGGGTYQLRSTAQPMETTMKSPIVATTDPSPFDPCQDLPIDALQRLGLAFTPPEREDGLRCKLDAGNYTLALEPIIWRTYDQSLPADALETAIQGHRAAQYWVMKPTYHNSFWFFSCMIAFKTSYGVLQQALYFSTIYSNPEPDCMPTNLQRANDLAPLYKF
ncbi:DUF3558 domain-containing protein [Mycobacterium sp.]|uniref:DUF3558 domain-containing protein n=1 Tax=Mycobacterium sp. TaxID=1785 RepID=UPI002D166E19|nr:DUF3558 domain-containing protein [Mycobacterium sp.]HTQ22051.1 DUF3558 domain-containing protein [Mycobacterium sp.]